MGSAVTKILPGLYVGSMENTKDEEELMVNCISHIIFALNEEIIIDKCPNRQYLQLLINENSKMSFIEQIPVSNDFIHQARVEGCNVLICSESGLSTNVAIAVAYLMIVYSLDHYSALSAIRGILHTANPTLYLKDQLELFDDLNGTKDQSEVELITASRERSRLFHRFGEWPLIEEDINLLNNALTSHQSLAQSGMFFNDNQPDCDAKIAINLEASLVLHCSKDNLQVCDKDDNKILDFGNELKSTILNPSSTDDQDTARNIECDDMFQIDQAFENLILDNDTKNTNLFHTKTEFEHSDDEELSSSEVDYNSTNGNSDDEHPGAIDIKIPVHYNKNSYSQSVCSNRLNSYVQRSTAHSLFSYPYQTKHFGSGCDNKSITDISLKNSTSVKQTYK